MIPDIRAYSAKRRKPAAREHHVYFIEFEGPQLIKVGRTHDLAKRMQEHQAQQKCIGRYFAQMQVTSAEESAALESALIAEMKLSYPRQHKEWFDVPLREVADVIQRVIGRMMFKVSVRGASTSFFESAPNDFSEEQDAIRRVVYQPPRNRLVHRH